MNHIAGIFNFDKPFVDAAELKRMTATMNSQNQNEHMIWIEGEVGFACAPIGNTPEANNKASPYLHPNQQWMIAFDGRIDNRQELMAILRPQWLAGSARISDEEIVLAAYQKWELGCPEHPVGDFAFAIWDKE